MEDAKKGMDKQAVMLEGIYRGLTGKIEAVSKELQAGAAQQAGAYETLASTLKGGIEKLLAELRYLSQQSSAIYDFSRTERASVRDAVLSEVKGQREDILKALTEYIDNRLGEIKIGVVPEIDYDLLADKVAARLSAEREKRGAVAVKDGEELVGEVEFDYETFAEKVASALPETDYDTIADKVAAVLPQPDENVIADRVAELIPPTDYELIAEKVTETAQGVSDDTVERIAWRVAELLRGEENIIISQSPAENKEEDELAVAEEPLADDKMIRYKRSFTAKIIASDEEVKRYYSDLKNAILTYSKVRSQINWTNDRFFLGNESIVKIGVRGKTLCLYLALNPDEFPTTVYHQINAGDTKMYELTPMMIKIKSKIAVKRGIRLIDLLMERNGLTKEAREEVDYAGQYFFRTDEELLAEGLIKTAIVDKSDLDF